MKRKLRIGIYVGSERKGLFFGIARELAREHDVSIIARDRKVLDKVRQFVPEMADGVLVKSYREINLSPGEITQEAVQREERYGERFSMLLSFDRGLGQGYLLVNADKLPHVERSLWPREKKLQMMIREFAAFEEIFDAKKFDLLLGHDRPIFLDLIARAAGVPYLTINSARFSDRYLWAETSADEKRSLPAAIQRNLERDVAQGEEPDYEEYDRFKVTRSQLDFSYREALRKSARIFLLEVYRIARGLRKQNSYRFCGWVPSLFRKVAMYDYIKRCGIEPEDLDGLRVVFYPLHQEPEAAVMQFSPEFSNSVEMVTWIAKSLPADTVLVLKENPWSFGVRSRKYYQQFLKMGNVYFSKPDVHSHDWVRRASVVANITGTVGIEAVYLRKPVLSFGAHQMINGLPSVCFAESFSSTRKALADALATPSDDPRLALSKRVYHKSLMEVSFTLPGLGGKRNQEAPDGELGRMAVETLKRDCAPLFGTAEEEKAERRPGMALQSGERSS